MIRRAIHSPKPGAAARLRAHGRLRTTLLAQAVVTLAAVSMVLRVMPFRRAIRFGSVPLRPRRPKRTLADDAAWAVRAATRRLPWRNVCIHEGLAMQRMLRRGGVDALLHYGAAHDGDGKLQAHVWVSVDGVAVIGGEVASRFREVAVFP